LANALPLDGGPDGTPSDEISDVGIAPKRPMDGGQDGGAPDAAIENHDGGIEEFTNHPPVLCPIGNKEVNEMESLQFSVCASDADGDSLIFGAGNLPPGSTFNVSNQLFNWIPMYEQAGLYQTTFLAFDGELSDVETINITVLDFCEKFLYEDADGDEFGNRENSQYSCELVGYVENALDCDDTNNTIYPGAPEFCDLLDNDCNPLSTDGEGETVLNAVQAGVCLGSTQSCVNGGWQEDYSGILGYEAGLEFSCDELDNDCDELTDESELLDHFNRPDQNGLGLNAFDNPWTEYGTLDHWDIVNNAAETFWIGGWGYNPNTNSNIGHKEKFNIMVKFHFFNTSRSSGNGALMVGINASSGGSNDGVTARISAGNYSTHKIVREGIDLVTGIRELQDNIDYLLRFSFNGSELQLNLWENGTVEPADSFLSAPAQDVPPTKQYLVLTGDMDTGERAGVSIDYLINESPSTPTSYTDNDGDGFGNPSSTPHTGCAIPAGYVLNAEDCNDLSSAINSQAIEECDGTDNNCDGIIDELCDSDEDSIPDPDDNCPTTYNAGLPGTLMEGESNVYQTFGLYYNVTVTFIDSDEAKFNVNGTVTPKLRVGESHTLQDTSKIIVRNILYQDYAGGIHSTTFLVGAQKDCDQDGIGDACDRVTDCPN